MADLIDAKKARTDEAHNAPGGTTEKTPEAPTKAEEPTRPEDNLMAYAKMMREMALSAELAELEEGLARDQAKLDREDREINEVARELGKDANVLQKVEKLFATLWRKRALLVSTSVWSDEINERKQKRSREEEQTGRIPD